MTNCCCSYCIAQSIPSSFDDNLRQKSAPSAVPFARGLLFDERYHWCGTSSSPRSTTDLRRFLPNLPSVRRLYACCCSSSLDPRRLGLLCLEFHHNSDSRRRWRREACDLNLPSGVELMDMNRRRTTFDCIWRKQRFRWQNVFRLCDRSAGTTPQMNSVPVDRRMWRTEQEEGKRIQSSERKLKYVQILT